MSYKCAILGHNYGDAEVEREREEDGNEVVITDREIETCQRCGDERIVSENKEVTTLETAADIVADDLDRGSPDQAAGGTGPATAGGAGGSDAGHDTEIPEAESTVPDEATDPKTDDGVILEAGDDATAEEDGGESESGANSKRDGDAESEPVESDGREPGAWPEEDQKDTSGGGAAEWPEEDDEDGTPDWELPSDIDPHPETEHTIERSVDDALTVPEGEFYCPECGFTTPVESSSLRAGDFCPECHKGALEHQRE